MRLRRENCTDNRELYRATEAQLDKGLGSCILKNPVAALAVIERLQAARPELLLLHGYCVMPNHVHVLISPRSGVSLADCMQFIKGGSSFAIHSALGGSGALWQREFFDRLIRGRDHFVKVRRYIEWNPVKAGLCDLPQEFSFSSFGKELDPWFAVD